MSSTNEVRRREFLAGFLEDAISRSKVNDRVLRPEYGTNIVGMPDYCFQAAPRSDAGWITLTRDVSAFQTLNVLCEKCQGEAQEKLLRSLARKPRAPTISDVARRCLVHLSPQKYHDPNIDPWTGMGWDYFIYVGQCSKCLTIYHAQSERSAKAP